MHIETLERRQLLAFGDLDSTFGVAGRALLPADKTVGPFQSDPRDLVVLNDGRIATSSDSGISMYTSSGQLDARFSGDAFVPIEGFNRRYIKQAPSGNLIVFSPLEHPRGKLTSYKLDGAIDSSFGLNGSIELPEESGDAFGSSKFDIDSQGRIYVFANGSPSPFDFQQKSEEKVIRLTADGKLDPTFGNAGAVRLNLPRPTGLVLIDDEGTYNHIDSIAIDSADRIVLAGRTTHFRITLRDPEFFPYDREQIQSFPLIARLNASGQLDASLDGDGVWHAAAIVQSNLQDSVTSIAHAKGSTVVAFNTLKRTTIIDVPESGSIDVSALRTNGAIDVSRLEDMDRLPDGRLVLTGFFEISWARQRGASDWETGPLMATVPFERVVGPNPDIPLSGASFSQIAVQPDGRIVAGGHGYFAGDDGVRGSGGDDEIYILARLNAGNASDPRPDQLPHGSTNSIAAGRDLELHVAYHDSFAKNLKYRFRDFTGRWSDIETIDAGQFTGDEPSLALDSKGDVAVAYFDGLNADLKLARRESSGTWSIETVDSRGGTGLYPDLKFDRMDRPWIAYYNKSRGDLRLAGFVNNAWSIETVDAIGDVGRTPQLVENPNTGRWSIAYTGTDKTVRFADRQRDKSFAIATAATTLQGGYYPTLAYEDLDGFPGGPAIILVAFYDANSGDLIVKRRLATGKNFSSTRLATRGATGLYPQVTTGDYVNESRIWWWDRSRNAVMSGTDRDINTGKPFVSAAQAALGGGRFLAVTRAPFSQPYALVYQDSASGDLFVRRG